MVCHNIGTHAAPTRQVNIDERSSPQQTGQAEQKCQDYDRIDRVWSKKAVGAQGEANSGRQC
jgi:hypothetical protein